MIHRLMGRCFEDFQVGDLFETPGRTIGEGDLAAFAGLTGDHSPLHTDEEYAKATIYGTRIAHGLLTLSFAFGLYTRLGLVMGTGMGNLGVSARFTRPVHIGDTIKTRAEVIKTRETSKPDRGIVTFRFAVVNQRDETVAEVEYGNMVKRRPSAS